MVATTTLERGPATATIAIPDLSGLRKLAGLTGVGLAQPNPASRSMAEPTGSRWVTGLSESLPWPLAVVSPSRFALSAWLNSWKVSATTNAKQKTANVTSP